MPEKDFIHIDVLIFSSQNSAKAERFVILRGVQPFILLSKLSTFWNDLVRMI